jgi:hypothetical protein
VAVAVGPAVVARGPKRLAKLIVMATELTAKEIKILDRAHSIRMHFPKIEFGPTQPLIRPRLLPIWKRPFAIALTRCRYSLPATLHKTISPTLSVATLTGATVHSWPDSIFPVIEFPRGLNETVSPALSLAI